MKKVRSLFSLLLYAFLVAAPARAEDSASAPASVAPPPAELLDHAFLGEVALHLYRWYMDESDIERQVGSDHVAFLVRTLAPPLDPEDQSQFAEIVLPAFGIRVQLKRPDYVIPELGVTVQTDRFKITRVAREPIADLSGGVTVLLPYTELREQLFRLRNQAVFPDPKLGARLRKALASELHRDNLANRGRDADAEQIVHLAPLSEVANELWIFWETGRLLIHAHSDIDLTHPAVWEHENLLVELFDVDEQVVVSHHEVPGSNAYLTRDQVGRILYNCVILGKRVVVTPEN